MPQAEVQVPRTCHTSRRYRMPHLTVLMPHLAVPPHKARNVRQRGSGRPHAARSRTLRLMQMRPALPSPPISRRHLGQSPGNHAPTPGHVSTRDCAVRAVPTSAVLATHPDRPAAWLTVPHGVRSGQAARSRQDARHGGARSRRQGTARQLPGNSPSYGMIRDTPDKTGGADKPCLVSVRISGK